MRISVSRSQSPASLKQLVSLPQFSLRSCAQLEQAQQGAGLTGAQRPSAAQQPLLPQQLASWQRIQATLAVLQVCR